ncbi:MAG: type II toxin-antitoxin system VapC family toxin [Hyphomicrobiales bacterium]|nr:type II toxin-antitoxin system VapC family toxin [Hyphomicrobiales bacterium]MDE2114409.1 type II toxin-antitoxin system VapC family toxin [Hyphomicrobiales bacterium]
MSFLIDTNVISELTRPNPDQRVVSFLHESDEDHLFVSVITLGELLRGVALKADGRAKSALDDWLRGDLRERFAGRILDVTSEIADRWGDLMATAKRQGTALHAMDGFLAATALVHGKTLVTRNVKDFAPFEVSIFNPWTPA